MIRIAQLFLLPLILVNSYNLKVVAEEVSTQPDKLIVSTPIYQPELSEFKPELGTYEFDVSWAGIPAATIYFDVAKQGPNYQLETRVKTAKAVSLFYRLEYVAKALLSGVDFRPIYSLLDSKENSRHKYARVDFESPDRVKAVYEYVGKDRKDYDFDPNNMMLEPFSAAFFARSLDWEPGTTRYFDTFNGRSRYLISFTGIDKVRMSVNGQDRDVWVVEPKVKKLSTTEDAQKLRKALIYITADEKREVLRLSSEVFIGKVNTQLKSFTPKANSGVSVEARNSIDYKF